LARSKQIVKKTAKKPASGKTAKSKAEIEEAKEIAAGAKAKSKKTAIKTLKPRTTATRRTVSKSNKKPIEQYDHKGKERVNNPPVGLVTEKTDKDLGKKKYAYDPHIDPALQFDCKRSEIENIIDSGLGAETVEGAKAALKELKKRQEPYLNWAGKAERTSFEVPTVSLHVHERIDPKTIIEAVKKKNGLFDQRDLFFSQPGENPPLRDAIEFYKHKHNWSNRLIAGDSLEVMNSLIEKEGLAGQVQMIYIDPPYGVKYMSNFQPFINQKNVADGKDQDLTQEPEMIKAFRDTWELGIHSYMSYLRDRIYLASLLLSESGSIFIQISNENIHHVKEIMDEIFGARNFANIITYRTKSRPLGTKLLETMADQILWYAKDVNNAKFNRLFENKNIEGNPIWKWVELENGDIRKLPNSELHNHKLLPKGSRVFRGADLRPAGFNANCVYDFEYKGKTYSPPGNSSWLISEDRMRILANKGYLLEGTNTLERKIYLNDFPISPINNLWPETVGSSDKIYVVQTSEKVLQRCLLMATDPGDLVFDPTCGSGTTAFVAEQWGRRWITCDTSRVALTLAKQRLMTSLFDYYELAHLEEGVGSGFKYKTVPHITLKSIANDEPPGEETLYDQPYIDNKKARVSGPFTVEAVPAPVVKPLSEITSDQPADDSVARSGETVRQSDWRDELFKTGIRGKGGQKIEFTRIEALPGTRNLHADGETKGEKAERVVVSFGPEHAPLEQRQVELAIEEARNLVPKPKIIVFAAFQFDPEAAKDIDETDWPGVTLLKAQMNTDLLTEDLKKQRSSNESFWLIGQPEIIVREIKEKGKASKYQVDLLGFDYFNTRTGTVESGGTEKIAMWMLDTDYDGRSLFPQQVFFPMSGPKDGWARLARNLQAEIDEELIEQYRGTTSLPFEPGDYRRIAVKIVDDRGIESLVIEDL